MGVLEGGMDEQAVEEIYNAIRRIIDGQDYGTVMIVLGTIHNECALQYTTDEKPLRALYKMMGEAAVCMANLEDGSNEFQTEKDPTQKTKRAKKRKTSWDEPGPFGAH